MEWSDLGWIFSINNIIGAILNVKKKRLGFALWFFGNIGFMLLSIKVPSLRPQIILWGVFTALAVYGWFEWGKNE